MASKIRGSDGFDSEFATIEPVNILPSFVSGASIVNNKNYPVILVGSVENTSGSSEGTLVVTVNGLIVHDFNWSAAATPRISINTPIPVGGSAVVTVTGSSTSVTALALFE